MCYIQLCIYFKTKKSAYQTSYARTNEQNNILSWLWIWNCKDIFTFHCWCAYLYICVYGILIWGFVLIYWPDLIPGRISDYRLSGPGLSYSTWLGHITVILPNSVQVETAPPPIIFNSFSTFLMPERQSLRVSLYHPPISFHPDFNSHRDAVLNDRSKVG